MKHIKKLLVFIFILSICFCSYSSIVSDEDGKGFVSKEQIENQKIEVKNLLEKYKIAVNEALLGKVYEYIASFDKSYKVTNIFNTVRGNTNSGQVFWLPKSYTWSNVKPGYQFVCDISLQTANGTGYITNEGHHTFVAKFDSGTGNASGTAWEYSKDDGTNMYLKKYIPTVFNYQYSRAYGSAPAGTINNIDALTFPITIDGFTDTSYPDLDYHYTKNTGGNYESQSNRGFICNSLKKNNLDSVVYGQDIFFGDEINTSSYYCYNNEVTPTYEKSTVAKDVTFSILYSYANPTSSWGGTWSNDRATAKSISIYPIIPKVESKALSSFRQFAIYNSGYSNVGLSAGIPIFKAPGNGTGKFKVKNYSTTDSATILISDRQFENSSTPTKISFNANNVGTDAYVIAPNSTADIAVSNCQYNTTYWIRVKPSGTQPIRVEVIDDVSFEDA